MKPRRVLALVLGLVLAIAACDRVVDLTASPDAGHADSHINDSVGNDGFGPDSGNDGGSVNDAGGIVPDAFTGD